MNGGTDNADGTVNATWLNYTTRAISKCEGNGITIVLATIPSVPNYSHVALNDWVRNSGHRYIDFASAVENDEDSYWKGWGTENALLSGDNIHPTVKGAIVLAAQAMIDFPELAIE